jgi:hypothetical protein
MAAAIRLSQQHSCSLDHLVGEREQHGGQAAYPRLEVQGLLVEPVLLSGGEEAVLLFAATDLLLRAMVRSFRCAGPVPTARWETQHPGEVR